LCWKKHLSDFLILCSTHGIHPAFGELELHDGILFQRLNIE
jgi:hypothetical protein